MNERDHGLHPDLDQLAEFAAGALAPTVATTIAHHLQTCVQCRLDVTRLQRFAAIDGDEALAAEAGWPVAEARLEAGLDDVLRQGRLGPARRRRALPTGRWLVPVAAAAVVALVLLGLPPESARERDGNPPDPRRGDPLPVREIVLEAPIGALVDPPREFRWRSTASFDAFVLEIVTPELSLVYRRAGITDTTFVVADTLLARLAADTPYLWAVSGERGRQVASVSAHAWFRLPPD